MSKRKFILGEEWLYYKIYCGIHIAEKLLIQMVNPLVKELKSKGLIEIWFFIRYSDPDPHLRLRIKLKNKNDIGQIILICQEYFRPYVDDGSIWNVSTGTYERELERYGKDSIEMVEKIFNYDSDLAITLIGFFRDDYKRFMHSIKYFESILNLFKIKCDEKLEFLRNHIKKNTVIKNSKDNKFKNGLEELNYHQFDAKRNDTQILLESYSSWNNAMKIMIDEVFILNKLGQIEVPILELLESIIHMFYNRVFIHDQRRYEFLGYYLMNSVLSSNMAER